MDLIRVQVQCTGVSPLLMNPATEELLDQLRGRIQKPKNLEWSVEDEAKGKIYMEDGQIGLPALNLFSCLVEAGRRVKFSARTSISTKESTLLPSFLSIEEMFLPFTHHSDWRVDKRRGRNPKDGVMVCIVRPRFDEWQFAVTLQIDKTKEDIVKKLVEEAGTSVGLGDFRPARRGLFGRFAVTKWEKLGGDASQDGQRRTPVRTGREKVRA
jgi:hypothetical protein